MKKIKQLLKIVPLVICAYAGSAQALVIHFNPAAGMDARALAGFQAAADRWSSVLHDNVQVNLDINFSALGAGILGSTGSTRGSISYGGFRDALAADATSMDDWNAVSHMSTSSCLNVMMNGTNINPNGVGNGATFVDNNCNANNKTVRMTLANARALGLAAAVDNVRDGTVIGVAIIINKSCTASYTIWVDVGTVHHHVQA